MLSPCLAPRCPELVQGETYCERHKQRAKAGAPGGPMLTPCIVPGCPKLVSGGRCDRHQAQAALAPGRTRHPRPGPNPYAGRWRDIAARYMREHPNCEWPGCTQPAALVHHKDGSGRRGAQADNSFANLQALCRVHHGAAHAQLHRAGVVPLGPRGTRVPASPGRALCPIPWKKVQKSRTRQTVNRASH